MKRTLQENNKTLLLALPIITGQLSQMLLGLVDTLMIGRLGTDELGAAAFVNVLFNFPFVFGIGLFSAVSVLVSHQHGAADHVKSGEAFRNGFILSFILSIFLTALLLATIPFLHLFRQPEIVTALAPDYLIWVALSLIPMIPGLTIKNFAEAKNHPWAVLWIMLGGVGINIILNYILIFGHLGFPKLGLAGGGIATFLARLLTLIVLWHYLNTSKVLANSRPRKWLAKLDYRLCLDTLKMATPISGQLTMEFGSFAIAALLIGQFGSASLAAHQIAINCAAFTFMIPLGMSMAVTIRIGHAIGASQIERSQQIFHGAQGTAFILMSLCAATFILGGDTIAAAFSTDPEVISLTSKLFVVVAFFQISDGFQIISQGALRGMRDVNIPTLMIFISFWLFGVPLGAALGFGAQMEALGLWIGLASGLTLAAIILTLRLRHLMQKIESPKRPGLQPA